MMKRIEEALKNGVLTQKEADVMNYLMTDGYYAEYTFSDLTVGDIAANVGENVKSTRGVVGSLVKKGYLSVDQADDDMPFIVYATDKGYEFSDEFETRWKPQMY